MPLSNPPYELGKTACYVSAVAKHYNSTFKSNLPTDAQPSLPVLSQFIVTIAGQLSEVGVKFDKALIQTSDNGKTALQASDLIRGYYRYLTTEDDKLSFDEFVSVLEKDVALIASERGYKFMF